MPQAVVCCHEMTGELYFPVFVFCVLRPCVDVLGLFVIGAGARVCGVFYGGVAALRDVLPLGVRLGGSYAPLGVSREYTYCGGVRG